MGNHHHLLPREGFRRVMRDVTLGVGSIHIFIPSIGFRKGSYISSEVLPWLSLTQL